MQSVTNSPVSNHVGTIALYVPSHLSSKWCKAGFILCIPSVIAGLCCPC